MLAGNLQIGPFLWFLAAIYLSEPPSLDKAGALQRLGAALAAADSGALDQQICQLQQQVGGGGVGGVGGPPLLTSRQLQYLCYKLAFSTANVAIEEYNEAGSMEESAAATAIMLQSSDRMLELEPTNAGTLWRAVNTQPTRGPGVGMGRFEAATQLYLRALEQALRQRRDLLTVLISSAAVYSVSVAVCPETPPSLREPRFSRSTAQAVVEAFLGSDRWLRTNKQRLLRILPEQWVGDAMSAAASARADLPAVQRFLDGAGPRDRGTAQPSSQRAELAPLRCVRRRRKRACRCSEAPDGQTCGRCAVCIARQRRGGGQSAYRCGRHAC